jgi:DNA-binding NarL/FixJ family response regulator
MIKYALIDDNTAFTDHIKAELSTYPDLSFCFMATNGKECLQLLAMLQADKLPDIMLMDIEMPEMDGIEATLQIHTHYPAIQIIMLTTFSEDDKVVKAIQHGAKGYLLKTEKTTQIYTAIQDINAGNSHLSPSIARKILNIFTQSNLTTKTNTTAPESYQLTQQEHKILDFVHKGYKYKRIGELLFIEESTVKKHIRNIYAKLNVHNKVEALNKLKSPLAPEGGI